MKVLQFLRGLPFGLVFLAFLLPLFIISCPGTDTVLAQGTVYESLDLVNTLGSIIGQMDASQVSDVNSSTTLFTVAIVAIMVLSAMAFGISFSNGKLSAVLGILAMGLMIAIVCILRSKSNEMIAVSAGSGAILSIVLYAVGIVLSFIPIKEETQLPSALKATLILIPTAIVAVCCTIGIMNSKAQGNEAGKAMNSLMQNLDSTDFE